MPIALSTAWNVASIYTKNARHALCGKITAEEALEEIRNLGFSELELSFNLSSETVNRMAEITAQQNIKINSLHNYCPVPEGLKREAGAPDCYSIASRDKKERELAVKKKKKTIETARVLGAQAVVLHCGRVEIKDRTRELIALYDAGRIQSDEAKSLKNKLAQERAQTSEEHLSNTIQSLSELYPYAKKLNIKLGIENRFYYREIPSYKEMGKLLNRFNDDFIGYWHDTGHAQLWENLEVSAHNDYLKNYGSRLIGFHLHGIEGARDHQAPLSGKGKKGAFDFNNLIPYVKKGALLTIESHRLAAAEDIIKAKKYLENIFHLNY